MVVLVKKNVPRTFNVLIGQLCESVKRKHVCEFRNANGNDVTKRKQSRAKLGQKQIGGIIRKGVLLIAISSELWQIRNLYRIKKENDPEKTSKKRWLCREEQEGRK